MRTGIYEAFADSPSSPVYIGRVVRQDGGMITPLNGVPKQADSTKHLFVLFYMGGDRYDEELCIGVVASFGSGVTWLAGCRGGERKQNGKFIIAAQIEKLMWQYVRALDTENAMLMPPRSRRMDSSVAEPTPSRGARRSRR